MGDSMLTYRDRDQFSAEPAVRKLLHMIFLMTIRDGSRQIAFQDSQDGIRLHCLAGSDWHEFVPPPQHLWPQLVNEVRRHSRLIRPPRGLVERLRSWFQKCTSVPEVGWLVYQFDNYRLEIAVILNPHPSCEEIRLSILTPAMKAQAVASSILESVFNKDGLFEFGDWAGHPACLPRT
jgi:hypothetical protein